MQLISVGERAGRDLEGKGRQFKSLLCDQADEVCTSGLTGSEGRGVNEA